jgi:glycosyltransferase involved in cell wall biosynthesis
MSETAGDAGFLVDPFNVESIVEGIKECLDSNNSEVRKRAMKKRLSQFSWEKSADLTLEVYKKAKHDGFAPAKHKRFKK